MLTLNWYGLSTVLTTTQIVKFNFVLTIAGREHAFRKESPEDFITPKDVLNLKYINKVFHWLRFFIYIMANNSAKPYFILN